MAGWVREGNIELMGGMDDEVKMGGEGIEVGEMEEEVMGCEGVKEAVVTGRKRGKGDGGVRGYVVGVEGSEVGKEEVGGELGGRVGG